MGKVLLLMLLISSTAPVLADSDYKVYHGWHWKSEAPSWLPANPLCRDFTIRTTTINMFGQTRTTLDTHTECQDKTGQWQLVF